MEWPKMLIFFFVPPLHRDITLRYKEIRRQKQEYKPEEDTLQVNGGANPERNFSKPKNL